MANIAYSPQSHCKKLGQDPVSEFPIREIIPSPDNDLLYRPIDPKSPDIQALAKSIRQHDVKEPLVITTDRYVLSGHRRRMAAILARLETVPCRIANVSRKDDPDMFLVFLREYNRQREKTFDERMREEVLSIDQVKTHEQLAINRIMRSWLDVEELEIDGEMRRCQISPAMQPLLNAIRHAIQHRRKYWPLTARMLHYALLNDPPLRHAAKPDSTYRNDAASYKSLVELLARARLAHLVPMEAIGDETRPVSVWNVHRTAGDYLTKELHDFCRCYWRDLMQSQPNHIEIVCEKNTVEPIVRPVASEFCIPLTSGRGFCSIPPRYAMAQRFIKSGRDTLIVLMVSDHDPDGDEIAYSFARSMRDDFHIQKICPVKVALTSDQVTEYDLPIGGKAKRGSANYKKFVDRHGDDYVFELEALEPTDLQQILRVAIESVIDSEAYEHELEQEQQDAAHLEGTRRRMKIAMQGVGLDESDQP